VLEIKLAVPRNVRRRGIYHEKLGIFSDAAGNQIVFTGSANESANALSDNFECLDVFRSWRVGDEERILEKIEDFQRLWDNQTTNLEVLEFSEVAQRSLPGSPKKSRNGRLHWQAICPPIIRRSRMWKRMQSRWGVSPTH